MAMNGHWTKIMEIFNHSSLNGYSGNGWKIPIISTLVFLMLVTLNSAPVFAKESVQWLNPEMYLRWMVDNMWLFVPAQVFTRQWLASFEEFPPVGGNTLGIDGVLQQLKNPAMRQ
jgi:hypothetical protein